MTITKGNIINYPTLSLIASTPKPASQVDQDVRAALRKILSSRKFCKAHRCTALLNYLIDRMLSHAPAAPTEHEIGVAVFGRDHISYFTNDDPIVRVQAGRLRQRLAAYYADEGSADPLRISIPLGSYQPRMTRAAIPAPQPQPQPKRRPVLMFVPLACLTPDTLAQSFTFGLNDELGFRLCRELSAYRLGAVESFAPNAGTTAVTHVLEGTVRRDIDRVRVSLHLRHVAEDTVVWYEQFDSPGGGSIAAQEQMADRCMQSLQRHMEG
jgi:TolB-like protein